MLSQFSGPTAANYFKGPYPTPSLHGPWCYLIGHYQIGLLKLDLIAGWGICIFGQQPHLVMCEPS